LQLQEGRSKLIILLIVAVILHFVSLWQLEIVFISMDRNYPFCLPFEIYCSYNYWIVRDWLYLLNSIAFFILLFYILKNIRKIVWQ